MVANVLEDKAPRQVKVEIYLNSGSPVFVCFIKQRKAFDSVNHTKLFNILKTRKISEYLIDGVMKFHHTLRFLTTFAGEVFFLLYYTICKQTVKARNYPVIVSVVTLPENDLTI